MSERHAPHKLDDGFGTVWECPHDLPTGTCQMEIVRPGKSQCPCDRSIADLIAALTPSSESTSITAAEAWTAWCDIPAIIRASTWKTPELRESAAKLVQIIIEENCK